MWAGNQNINSLTNFNQQSNRGSIGGYPQFAANSNGFASIYGPSSGYSSASSGYGPSASGYGPTSTANGPTSYAFSPNNAVYRKAGTPVYGSKSDHSGHSGGGGHASYSGGGGYGKMDKCPGIPLSLLLITLLGIAITGAILFLKIQAAGKRKRRSAFHWDDLPQLVAIGRRIFQ